MPILENKISLLVPSTSEFSRDVSDIEFFRRSEYVAGKFVKLFGGVTVLDSTGKAPDAYGNLIDEKIRIVYSWMSEKSMIDNYQSIITMAKRLGKKWYQSTMILESVSNGKEFAELINVHEEKEKVTLSVNGKS